MQLVEQLQGTGDDVRTDNDQSPPSSAKNRPFPAIPPNAPELGNELRCEIFGQVTHHAVMRDSHRDLTSVRHVASPVSEASAWRARLRRAE